MSDPNIEHLRTLSVAAIAAEYRRLEAEIRRLGLEPYAYRIGNTLVVGAQSMPVSLTLVETLGRIDEVAREVMETISMEDLNELVRELDRSEARVLDPNPKMIKRSDVVRAFQRFREVVEKHRELWQ